MYTRGINYLREWVIRSNFIGWLKILIHHMQIYVQENAVTQEIE
jgi:hypothetical protein